jgi:hypothetical protein
MNVAHKTTPVLPLEMDKLDLTPFEFIQPFGPKFADFN